MTNRQLLEAVARGLGWKPWTEPPEFLSRWDHPDGRVSFQTDWRWLTSLDACQRDLLPDLERRGAVGVFVFALSNRWSVTLPLDVVVLLLKASPRQWCECYIASISESTTPHENSPDSEVTDESK